MVKACRNERWWWKQCIKRDRGSGGGYHTLCSKLLSTADSISQSSVFLLWETFLMLEIELVDYLVSHLKERSNNFESLFLWFLLLLLVPAFKMCGCVALFYFVLLEIEYFLVVDCWLEKKKICEHHLEFLENVITIFHFWDVSIVKDSLFTKEIYSIMNIIITAPSDNTIDTIIIANEK